MTAKTKYDAVVVGAGPNGLAAAIRLAQNGLSVLVLEANDTIGGSCRSSELTLPGFVHDLCSAIFPLGIGSPFFRQLPLTEHGLTWLHPDVPLAHPLPDGAVALLHRSVETTGQELGADGTAYRRLMASLVDHWQSLAVEFLQPLLHVPKYPFQLARFGWLSVQSGVGLAHRWFAQEPARALFAGLVAHSFLRLDQVASASFGLVLGMMGHAVGWPLPRGGAQQIALALASYFKSLGGEIRTGCRIGSLDELPATRATLFDVTPRQLLRIGGEKLPSAYRRRLSQYRYGPGVFKIDYALNGPIPWRSAECQRAGTVHLGGTMAELALAEEQTLGGKTADRPFVLLAQPTLIDPLRAPPGKHVAWAYCHVPNGSNTDMTATIENQIERFAPGFRDQVLARHTLNCAQLEANNANLVGGDISGGAADLWQLLARPLFRLKPYRIPVRGLYLCSASTPPGGGVHGMCGFHAAETALKDCFGTSVTGQKN
jgi:phytoene dehydrogenase-like protein